MFVEQVQLSGLMTFFFSIFYLQWAINRYVVGDHPDVSPLVRAGHELLGA